VWKAINAKPARQATPTLLITKSDDSIELEITHTHKVTAIAAISFPDKDDDPIPPTPKATQGAPPFRSLCVKGLHEILSTTSNTSAQGPDGIGYQALRLWNTIDPVGLCHLIDMLIIQGLPRDPKNAKVVVIGKPGKKDLSNPKSYRCIFGLSSILKLTEKEVAQYLSLEGEFRGWWHRTQFGPRPGRNTIDALMWLKSIVAQNRHEHMNTVTQFHYCLLLFVEEYDSIWVWKYGVEFDVSYCSNYLCNNFNNLQDPYGNATWPCRDHTNVPPIACAYHVA
jgi:hypothetical protein